MNPSPHYNGNGNGNGSGAPQRAARAKVTFEANIPQVLTLEFEPPAESRMGNWGPQYMYFCNGNAIAFLEPDVHAQLLELNAQAGEVFAIVKRKSGRANRWEVNRVENGRVQPRQPEAPPPPPPAAPAPPLRSAPRTAPPPIREGSERIAGNLMASALKLAIEACELCEFAASHEDVRALAITIYIAHTGGKAGKQ